MKNLLVINFLLSKLIVFGQNHSSEFGLIGQVQQVEVTVLKNSIHFEKKGKKPFTTIDTLESGLFEFTPMNILSNQSDSNFHLIQFRPIQKLDTTKFKIKYNPTCSCETATKITEDSSEFEIHYRKYDTNGLLVSDSSINRKKYEIYHEGSIIQKYSYDKYGNLIYHWFKSSFVFALTENLYFEYVYDIYGNWIERRMYVLPISRNAHNEFEFDTSDQTALYITKREIIYRL